MSSYEPGFGNTSRNLTGKDQLPTGGISAPLPVGPEYAIQLRQWVGVMPPAAPVAAPSSKTIGQFPSALRSSFVNGTDVSHRRPLPSHLYRMIGHYHREPYSNCESGMDAYRL